MNNIKINGMKKEMKKNSYETPEVEIVKFLPVHGIMDPSNIIEDPVDSTETQF